MGVETATAVRRDRDMVYVAGPDACAYLQGQLSQDVNALAAAEAAYTFVLQPTGKVDAWLRITRMADDAFLLDEPEMFRTLKGFIDGCAEHRGLNGVRT